MIAWAGIPLLAAVIAPGLVRRWSPRLAPSIATAIIATLALTIALSSGLVLSAIAAVSLAQLSAAAEYGQWSTAVIRAGGIPNPYIGAALAAIVLTLLGTGLRRIVLVMKAEREATAAVRVLHPDADGLIVVDDAMPSAFAVGLGRGCVVVSTGMLNGLAPPERDVLLAHERAHLRYRHQWYVRAVEVSAAANPLLRPLIPLVRRAIERWADELAARQVGERRLVAVALARAAVLRSQSLKAEVSPSYQWWPSRGLAVAESDVSHRVDALLGPAPSTAVLRSYGLAASAGLCWVAGAVLIWNLHQLIEWAEIVYSH